MSWNSIIWIRTRVPFCVCGLVILGWLTTHLVLTRTVGANDLQVSSSMLRPLCALWHGQASEAIALRVIEGRDDVYLKRVSDDIFRMRRARRSCDVNSIKAACQDYLAIIRNVGGTAREWPGSTMVCPAAMIDEEAFDLREP